MLLSQRRRKEIASLTVKKYRDERGEMLIEGTRSVEAAIEAGAPIREIVLTESARSDARIASALRRSNAPVYVVSERELGMISEVETSQGVLAVASIERVALSELAGFSRVLALDAVQDPGNAGTTIRTAAWFGVEAVLTGSGTVDLYNPKVIRAAMGGLWDLRHAESHDLSASLRDLTGSGFGIYGADLDGTSAERWRPNEKSVLVLGNEAHGLSAEVKAVLDDRIAIPQSGGGRGVESLNVGVAAGILLYEWTKNTRPVSGGAAL